MNKDPEQEPEAEIVDAGRRHFIASSGVALGATSLSGLTGAGEKPQFHHQIIPEKRDLTLGFLPLTDCAPLVVALEHGVFARYGLDVQLKRESSWANVRDKVAVGALDGAQMLAGIPLAIELGISPVKERMQTSLSLDLNGNGITVSNDLFNAMLAHDPDLPERRPALAHSLRPVINDGRQVRLAMVSRYSQHNYLLRYWLAAAGIDPDRDLDIIVVPPTHMEGLLRAGDIDGFCVGEPFNTLAVMHDVGVNLVCGYEIWNNSPEKVFAVTQDWARRYPRTNRAVTMALLEASAWLDQQGNRRLAAELLAAPDYLDTDPEAISMALGGHYLPQRGATPRAVPDFNVFHRYAANFPWRSHAMWIISQMYRWGQIEESVNIRRVSEAVYQPQVFRQSASLLDMPYPIIDYKQEGMHDADWSNSKSAGALRLGADRFLDGRQYDPHALMVYLEQFEIHHMKVSLQELALQNA